MSHVRPRHPQLGLLNHESNREGRVKDMPCKLTYDKDGNLVSAVCGPTVKADPCDTQRCHTAHTKLCDFPLKGDKLGQTCDRKMCGKHANPYPVKDLPPDVRKRVLEYDTFDLCDAHLMYLKIRKEGVAILPSGCRVAAVDGKRPNQRNNRRK